MYFGTPCWRKQMCGKGSLLVDPCYSSLVHRLASSASCGSRSETDLWALPQTHWSESAIQPETPRGSDWPRGVHMRHTDHSCQILAKVASFLPRNQLMHAGSKVFYFPLGLQTIFLCSLLWILLCLFFCFFPYTATTSLHRWFPWNILTFINIRTYLTSTKKIW